MILKDVLVRPDSHYGFKNKPKYPRVGWGEERAKDGQKKPIYRIEMGKCPCKVCNHTDMAECYNDGVDSCNCCSEFCT